MAIRMQNRISLAVLGCFVIFLSSTLPDSVLPVAAWVIDESTPNGLTFKCGEAERYWSSSCGAIGTGKDSTITVRCYQGGLSRPLISFSLVVPIRYFIQPLLNPGSARTEDMLFTQIRVQHTLRQVQRPVA